MEFVDNFRKKPLVQKVEKFIPAIAFLGGFGWDSITLGQMVEGSDLVFLLAYYVGALLLIILLSAHLSSPKKEDIATEPAAKVESDENTPAEPSKKEKHYFLDREWSVTWKQRFTWAVQFCYGSMFSALVVCYFKSSGSFTTFILVVLLAVLLVCNEFLQKRYESFAITLALFCLLGTMFLNFAIPHLVHRIGFFWFFLSTLISFAVCTLIWFISRRKPMVLIAPGVICILLIISYAANLVPPVPLVMKKQMVCINFEKDSYSCEMDKPTIPQRLGFTTTQIHKQDAGKIYFATSVYAPADLKAELEYRWYYADPKTGRFGKPEIISTSGLKLRGGRAEGYRSYSNKSHFSLGVYRVETAYRKGAVIGSMTFEIVDGEPENGIVRDTL